MFVNQTSTPKTREHILGESAEAALCAAKACEGSLQAEITALTWTANKWRRTCPLDTLQYSINVLLYPLRPVVFV
jgi:hypothetical protein